MTRAVLSAAIDSDWRLVSSNRPCPVCGSEDQCSIHLEADFVCCAQEPSQWKLTNGSWLHRLPSPLSLAPEAETEHSPSGIRVRL
jgi:hypothetical protein